MKINAINQNSFLAKIKISKDDTKTAGAASTLAGSMSTLGTVSLANSGIELAGTAFILDSSGINSSGIVPLVVGVVDSSSPILAQYSENYPFFVGSLLSSSGYTVNATTNNTVKKLFPTDKQSQQTNDNDNDNIDVSIEDQDNE